MTSEPLKPDRWQWQEFGTTWKGAALYHVTLTVTDRSPVLGRLDMPDATAASACVVRTPLGDALVDCLMSIPAHRPEVRVLHFCLMPDHLHAVLYVQRAMEKGIGTVARGFWQAAKKLGRASSQAPFFLLPNAIREKMKEESRRLQELAAALPSQMGTEAYYRLPALFQEMPFLRPMSRRTQLPNTIRYIDMNPQRLATKRLMPGFFRVQQGIAIGSRSYDAVGNIALLQQSRYAPVHVRRAMVDQADHGTPQPLRDYKNGCVLDAIPLFFLPITAFATTTSPQMQSSMIVQPAGCSSSVPGPTTARSATSAGPTA